MLSATTRISARPFGRSHQRYRSLSMASDAKLFVRSYVARDLLQNAALFKSDKLAVWEYVSNSLQYVDPGTNPVVRVLFFFSSRRRHTRCSRDWSSDVCSSD